MRLYEISAQLRAALDAAAESEEPAAWADTLEALDGDFEAKAIAVACYIKERKAIRDALKQQREAFEARFAAERAKIERLESYLQSHMQAIGKTRIEGVDAKVAIMGAGGNRPVLIDDECIVPDDFHVKKTTLTLDKDRIRAALEAGQEVPGARLGERGKRLEIK